MVSRIATGISGFDSLIGGGFFEDNHVLVSGIPGSGKTIFCLQVLYNMALNGDKCLFITLEENQKDIERQMLSFGWNIKKVSDNFKVVSLFDKEIDVFSEIVNLAKGFNRIVIDSLVSVAAAPVSEEEMASWDMLRIANSVSPVPRSREETFRMQIKGIIRELKKLKALVFYTSEMPLTKEWLSRDTVSEFLCDGVIMLSVKYASRKPFHTIQIIKLRSTKIDAKEYLLNFAKNGITISVEK